MFVFMTGAENFIELYWQAADLNNMYPVFFIVYSILGLMLVMSLVIATFQKSFEHHEEAYDNQRKRRRHKGLAATFELWTYCHAVETKQSQRDWMDKKTFVSLMMAYWQ